MESSQIFKLRPDLQISQEAPTQYDLSDPNTGNRLILDSKAYVLVEIFEDGKTLEAAQKELREKFHVKIEKTSLLEFLNRCRELNFLENLVPGGPLEGAARELRFELDPRLRSNEVVEDLLSRSRMPWWKVQSWSRKTRITFLFIFVFIFLPWKMRIKGPLVVLPTAHVIELHVNEHDISHVQMGRRVVFRVQAFPTSTYLAQLVEISTTAKLDPHQAESYFLVYAKIEGSDAGLAPGMTGVAKIDGSGLAGTSWDFLGSIFFRHAIRSLRLEYVI